MQRKKHGFTLIVGIPLALFGADVQDNPGEAAGGNGTITKPWITFQKHLANPVLLPSPGDWDRVSVRQNGILKVGQTYYLFYSGIDNPEQRWQIGLATSADMINWMKYPGNPVIPLGKPGDFDWFFAMYPDIIRRGDTYYMLYMGASTNIVDIPFPAWNMQIGLATSKDLLHWTKYGANPVFPKGQPGAWDSRGVWDHSVIYHEGKYYMTYGGNDVMEGQGSIGLATSPDLIHWERHPDNPIVRGRLECTELFSWGDAFGMLYVYWDKPFPDGRSMIGLMASRDLVHWTLCPHNPVLAPTEPWESTEDNPNSGVGSPAVLVEGGKLKVIYHGGDVFRWADGYAEADLGAPPV